MKTKLLLLLFLFEVQIAFSQGRIFIPENAIATQQPHLYLNKVEADVKLKNGVGTVTLEQVFFNPSPMRLAGDFIFPLPSNAHIYDFNLYINGTKTPGELLEAKEAAKIYTDIVRSLRDPALLEYANYGCFKARIFPIEPNSDRKIELSYAQTLSFDSKTYKFTLPIRQSGEGKIASFHMKIQLENESAISNIYSPTHSIDINREKENLVTISLEEQNVEGDKDFVLYYSLAEKHLDASMLAFRPRTDRDGYFMLMISPVFEEKKSRIIPKDVIFVVDCSGSMKGEKLEQAQEALSFCIQTLHPEDRFEIIQFSSSLENFQGRLEEAGSDEIKNAKYFIDNLRAVGGTNINAALQKALKLKEKSDDRPTSIIFLTDGLPTEGETDIKNILQNYEKESKEFIRIFSFGVGYDVNTFLLDKLSQDSHGSVKYVKPGENVEQEVSNFFARISDPVLTIPSLNWEGVAVSDIYPRELPDIFRGQRMTLFGRYRNSGIGNIQLSGISDNKKSQFDYKVKFPDRESEQEFIAKLWAQRKITHLLEQIRFNGENPELVESIKDLAIEFGIVTPYTSYLVREQERELADAQNDLRSGRGGFHLMRLESKRSLREEKAETDEESIGSAVSMQVLSAAPLAAGSSVGKDAVTGSRILKKIANAEKAENMLLTVSKIADKTFMLKKGIWIQFGIENDPKPIQKIKFLSDAYFDLCKNQPQIGRILALGSQVKFNWEGKIYQIFEDKE